MSTYKGVTILLICALGTVASNPQAMREISPGAEQHIRQLADGLPPESLLRRELLNGAHGDGSRKPWMDDMRHEGIKRALVWIAIDFNRHGKPERMRIQRTDYFTMYEGGSNVLDPSRLIAIRTGGLEQKLTTVALENVAHGFWVDVPRPRPLPFIGRAQVEFFDDEWIPTLKAPLYCAGTRCLPKE